MGLYCTTMEIGKLQSDLVGGTTDLGTYIMFKGKMGRLQPDLVGGTTDLGPYIMMRVPRCPLEKPNKQLATRGT